MKVGLLGSLGQAKLLLLLIASLLSPVRHDVDFGHPVLFKGNGLADA